jgi:hypothetical protein
MQSGVQLGLPSHVGVQQVALGGWQQGGPSTWAADEAGMIGVEWGRWRLTFETRPSCWK